MSFFGWKPYVPVAERRRKAAQTAARFKKKGLSLSPVPGRRGAIAKSFWGKAWCANLERYSDYSNRLPRGRTYVRNGSVIDLKIAPGEVQARVVGTSLYKITVSVADATELGDNRLVVTYAYRTGSRSKSYEQLCDEGAELGRAHNASWSDTPTVVQKVFAAKDLPATFEIDIPTPKGKYPVYPRMLFVRREVVAPGDSLMPLPEGAVAPKPSAAEDLRTLPNPFAVGIKQK